MTERRVRDIIADAGDAGDAVQGFIEDMEPGGLLGKSNLGFGRDDGMVYR